MTEGQITILNQILIISMDRYNPKPDLDNINAYSKFGLKALLFTQVIVRKRKYGRVSGR